MVSTNAVLFDYEDISSAKQGISKASGVSTQIKKLVEKSRKVLFHVSSVFPFDFFPTELTIDELKVTVNDRYFFGAERVRSIEIKNVNKVTVESGPLFAKLRIEGNEADPEPMEIAYLKKEDALRARNIIQGIIITIHEGIVFETTNAGLLKKSVEIVGKPMYSD